MRHRRGESIDLGDREAGGRPARPTPAPCWKTVPSALLRGLGTGGRLGYNSTDQHRRHRGGSDTAGPLQLGGPLIRSRGDLSLTANATPTSRVVGQPVDRDRHRYQHRAARAAGRAGADGHPAEPGRDDRHPHPRHLHRRHLERARARVGRERDAHAHHHRGRTWVGAPLRRADRRHPPGPRQLAEQQRPGGGRLPRLSRPRSRSPEPRGRQGRRGRRVPARPAPRGATGATGATGARGPRGRDATVTCKVTQRKRRKPRIRCTVRLRASGATRASLTRRGRTYARVRVRKGRVRISASPGRYVLHVRFRSGRLSHTAIRLR